MKMTVESFTESVQVSLVAKEHSMEYSDISSLDLDTINKICESENEPKQKEKITTKRKRIEDCETVSTRKKRQLCSNAQGAGRNGTTSESKTEHTQTQIKKGAFQKQWKKSRKQKKRVKPSKKKPRKIAKHKVPGKKLVIVKPKVKRVDI